MTLEDAIKEVPKGWQWLVRNHQIEQEEGAFANVMSPDFHSVVVQSLEGGTRDVSPGVRFPVYAATPALALMIAAKMARAWLEDHAA